ncbi:hypothetical protein ABPG74_001592 [Tetrahymena malaccensis]
MQVNNIVTIFLDIAQTYFPQKQPVTDEELSMTDQAHSSFEDFKEKFDLQELQITKKLAQIHENYTVNDSDHFDQELEQKFKQKQNVIKNILKNFLKYLRELNDYKIIQKYESIFNPKSLISYCEIKKQLSKKVNDKTTRWNFKLKSVISSQNMNPIFYDYLTTQSKTWLENSRVSSVLEHEQLIEQIIKSIQKEQPLKIKIYKKKK